MQLVGESARCHARGRAAAMWYDGTGRAVRDEAHLELHHAQRRCAIIRVVVLRGQSTDEAIDEHMCGRFLRQDVGELVIVAQLGGCARAVLAGPRRPGA